MNDRESFERWIVAMVALSFLRDSGRDTARLEEWSAPPTTPEVEAFVSSITDKRRQK